MSFKPWSLKFWLASVVTVTILSCSVTSLIVVYGLISESLKPCNPLDSYLHRSNCLKILQYSYYESYILDISFSPDGQLIAAGGTGGIPTIWNVKNGEVLHRLETKAGGAIDNVLFSPDGQTITLAQNYTSNTLTIIDPESGSILVQLKDHLPINDIAYSSDGTVVAIASNADNNNAIELRQVSDGQLLRSFSVENDEPIRKVALSSDGRKLFAVIDNGPSEKIQSWQVSDGIQVDTIRLDVKSSLGTAFSPDRNILALGNCTEMGERDCVNAEVTLWQVSDGQLLRRLDVPGSYVFDLAFSVDGTTLVSSSTDGNTQGYIQLWRVQDGTLLDTLGEHKGLFNRLAFSPDGTILAVGLTDVTLWKVE